MTEKGYSRRAWKRKMERLTLAFRAATPPGPYQLAMLLALQDRPQYQGTASAKAVASRRSLGKRQKASRRANRG